MLRLDEQCAAFTEAYPAGRRQRGYMVDQLFLAAVAKVGFDAMMTALEQHKRSVQWRETPHMIPSEKKWLEEERWIQVLPERRSGEDRRSPDRQVPGRRQVPNDEPL